MESDCWKSKYGRYPRLNPGSPGRRSRGLVESWFGSEDTIPNCFCNSLLASIKSNSRSQQQAKEQAPMVQSWKETERHLLSRRSWAKKNSSGSLWSFMSKLGNKSSTEGLSNIEHKRNMYPNKISKSTLRQIKRSLTSHKLYFLVGLSEKRGRARLRPKPGLRFRGNSSPSSTAKTSSFSTSWVKFSVLNPKLFSNMDCPCSASLVGLPKSYTSIITNTDLSY